MKVTFSIIVLVLILGCRATSPNFVYSVDPYVQTPPVKESGIADAVKVRVVRGLTTVKPTMSVAWPYTVDVEVIEGQIPSNPALRRFTIRARQSWLDNFLVTGSEVTLWFDAKGNFVGIKEFEEERSKLQGDR